MPTSEEIQAFQAQHPVKVYGANGPLRDPYRLGDMTVITFYDHEAAIKAAVQQATDRYNAEHVDDRLAAFENGAASERERIRRAVEVVLARWAGLIGDNVISDILAVIDNVSDSSESRSREQVSN